MIQLTAEQQALQSLFKEFINRLVADAAKYTGGGVRIKTDLNLGVAEEKQKDKAFEYAKVMEQIIKLVETEQQGKNIPGPAGILAQ